MKKIRVKICCIQNVEEAVQAIEFGASALGLVARMPSGPGVISDKQILSISKAVPPPIATFLLTSETEALEIVKHQQKVQTNTIQIVDRLQKGDYQTIKNELNGIKIVQVIHVSDTKSLDEAKTIAEFVDAILLDSGNPNLKIKELGGTGRIHDWKISREIVKNINVPVFLAGGLSPDNIKQAIDIVEPFGVDICSGVRSNGKLDLLKLEKFMKIVDSY